MKKRIVAGVAAALMILAILSASAKPNPDKELCKKGGWMTMHRADGTGFTNQGDCVSYGAQGGVYGTAGGGGGGTGGTA